MPTPDYTHTLQVISAANAAIVQADTDFAEKSKEFDALKAEYQKLRGNVSGANAFLNLLQAYGPKAATYFGLPGGAAAITALTADTGSFSSLKSVLGKVLGLFGFGG